MSEAEIFADGSFNLSKMLLERDLVSARAGIMWLEQVTTVNDLNEENEKYNQALPLINDLIDLLYSDRKTSDKNEG